MDRNEIADVISALRANLEAAQKAGQGHDIRFTMDEVEVELNVATTGDAKAEGGIKFWVLNFGAGMKSKDEHTQKVRLKMKAVDMDGKPLLVSDRGTK
jgi:Trypsin-co-occurring domain 2